MTQSIHNHHPGKDFNYLENLRRRLLLVLSRSPARFEHLLQEAEGAYPTDVQQVLQDLESEGQLRLTSNGEWTTFQEAAHPSALKPDGPQTGPSAALSNDLPEPHPLDFDWRFADEAIHLIVQELRARCIGNIAVLGAPTVFRCLVDQGIPAHLFDKNAAVLDYLKQRAYHTFTEIDLLCPGPLPSGRFECVVADPPWYPEHYEAFIDASRTLLKIGGRLFLSVLPRLTRPGAEETRQTILTYAAARGFEITNIIPSALTYVSPPFEKAALKIEGLVLGHWRTADLFELEKKVEVHTSTRQLREPDTWQNFLIGRVQVRLLPTRSDAGFKLCTDPQSWRLRSVSRRSPARTTINVWTSRNLALTVSDTRPLGSALQLLQAGSKVPEAVAQTSTKHQLDKSQSQQLRQIIEAIVEDSK
ncbi:MAG: hypothetical protein JWQ87_3792 [Candidatus Sulfotelmatobacter sp.]|nr:hypothetical protein [Candidatus Sulfotelmatobacter sp.]